VGSWQNGKVAQAVRMPGRHSWGLLGKKKKKTHTHTHTVDGPTEDYSVGLQKIIKK
jgi:hypothetical protein